MVKVLQHARNETKSQKVGALVFVGDCFEEDVDAAGKVAGELGLLGLPAFMFHEGNEPLAAFAFKQIAQLSGGAYCSFRRQFGGNADGVAARRCRLRRRRALGLGGFGQVRTR